MTAKELKIKDMVQKSVSGEWKLKQYRTWLKTEGECHCCGKKIRRFVGVFDKDNNFLLTVCPECAKIGGFDIQPATMKIDEDKIAGLIAKKFMRVFTGNPLLECIKFNEDIVSILAKTCDKIKNDAKKNLEKELSFNK